VGTASAARRARKTTVVQLKLKLADFHAAHAPDPRLHEPTDDGQAIYRGGQAPSLLLGRETENRRFQAFAGVFKRKKASLAKVGQLPLFRFRPAARAGFNARASTASHEQVRLGLR